LERAKAAFKAKNVAAAYYHPLLAGSFAVSTDGEAAELLPGVKVNSQFGIPTDLQLFPSGKDCSKCRKSGRAFHSIVIFFFLACFLFLTKPLQ